MTDRDDVLYQMAKIVSYPTWISAFILGILLAAGVISGAGWLIAILILLGVAMPIGVKLSRMELTNAMVAVFQTGIRTERQREKDMAKYAATPTAMRKDLLTQDIAAMIQERVSTIPVRKDAAEELAGDIIVVARERFLRDLATYSRENTR